MSAIPIAPNSPSNPDIIAAIDAHAALIDAHAGGGVAGWHSLADFLVKNDESAAAANSTAMQALWNTVIAAGGGTIYVPVGIWYHAINSASAVVKLTGAPGVPINARIVIRGEGPGSVLAWGGDAGLGAKDFFQFNSGVWNITFIDLKLIQNRAILNPDKSEQHHFIDSLTAKWANNENISVINCHFGVVKGDCVRSVGGQAITAAHASYAGNNAANLFPGPITQPTFPQRVSARYAANWDGTTVTVVGTDVKGNALAEVIPAPLGTGAQTMIGQKEFKTIMTITKGAIGASAADTSIGYDYRVRGTSIVNCVFDGSDWLNSDPGHGYRAPISVQRSTSSLLVYGCRMKGSDDQLIDLEPTSNGDVTDIVIVNNVFDAHDFNAVTITLTGNGSRDTIKRTIFANNIVRNGRISGSDLEGVLIQGNRIFLPLAGVAVGILMTKLCRDVQIVDNEIVADAASSTTYAIAVQRNSSSNDAPTRLVVRDNVISTPCANGGGIYVENPGDDIILSGNTVRNLSATAAKGVGVRINIATDTGAKRNHHITGNTCSAAGGGTLHSAFHYTAQRADPSNVVIMGNTANGCVRGVNVDALTTGVWTGYPVVSCNGLVGCSAPIVLGTGVYAVVGGQQGRVAQYIGAGSPEAAVIAFIGSTFQREDGGAGTSFYVKEAASTLNTGWVGK